MKNFIQMNSFRLIGLAALAFFINYGCHQERQFDAPKAMSVSLNDDWNRYWYSGKAEVNSYQLVQSRYGESRLGQGILIFVTEDFSKSKQVKLDNPNQSTSDNISVLKSNIIRKFNTGIYDYSMMTSVFTPISLDKNPHTLKLSMSSQEWCGQTFTQINRSNKSFNLSSMSYFESEGDESLVLKADWLEDELWNRIRIDAETIPLGNIEIIPGSFHIRLTHQPFQVQKAELKKLIGPESTTFELVYKNIDRILSITIENHQPYRILNWEETSNGNRTSGKLMRSMHIPYWEMNSNRFDSYRDSLLLN